MAKKVFYLGTCSTCSRIMKALNLEGFEKREIKSQAISESELEEMKNLAGSYEALFSRVAMKYRALGLNEKNLGETDFKNWILKEYTFLKRPVFIVDHQIFIGNSKKVIATLQTILNT